MKTIIHCDQVFEALTAGPFPTGNASDSSIQEHLNACSECKQLAEALKPACNLLREALPLDEKHGLPVYHDAEELALQENLQIVMQRIQPVHAPATTRRGWSNPIWASLCVTLLVMLIASGAAPWNSGRSSTTPDWQPLESLSMSSQCYLESASEATISVGLQGSERKYVCCTDCHNSTPQGNRQANASSLLASCGTCHN